MKKRFSRRRNSIIGAYPWLGPVAAVLIVLAVLFLVLRLLLPGALVAIATPLWTGGSALSAGVGNTFSFFGDKQEIIDDRNRYREEATALYVENQTLEARVRDLERLLGNRTEPTAGILAGVLTRPPVSPYDVLVVDQGSDAGIVVGNRVSGIGGLPLGVVESVTRNSARILMYSAPRKETESWVGDTRIPVSLIGEGGGAMRAEVAREAGIVVGDFVYVAGPGAIPLGTVTAVGNDPSSPRSRVDIKPLANPFSVTWVTIHP